MRLAISTVALISAFCAVGSVAAPVTAATPGAGLALVGRNSLGNRGMNAALAVADHCAYVGSRNDAAPQVIDITAPANPKVVGSLTAHTGSTPRELRTVPALHELAVLFYKLNGGVNGVDLYRWRSSCESPSVVGHYDFGGAAPHEFFLWQDPARPARVLLFVSMFATSPDELQVVDITNPASPAKLGGWAVPPGYGHAPLHSIALAPDGRTAYVSLWTGGLIVADTSDFVTGKANPVLRPLTPAGSAFKTASGNVHSAVPWPGQSSVLTTDERYPSPFGAGCPFGSAHVVDVADPSHPVPLSTLSIPENQPAACPANPRATWTSHNPTLTAHLALLTWYSAGLQVFALDDPARPVRVAEYRASGVNPARRDLQLGDTDTMSWSYPVIARGLIYLADINQGLLVLRYAGPHQDELTGLSFAEGNSNLGASSSAPVASPSPSTAGPAPSVSPGPTAVPPAPAPRQGGFTTAASAGAAVLLLAIGLFVVRTRRRAAAISR
ncbi:MAG TPA: hypothetical protein VGR61_04145 [Candidatus Dormibacteraeota bacterium]|nr:hypothetical protein [Candidatus Dormibacteraeota bacterium]